MSTDVAFAPLAYPVLRDDAMHGAEERARVRGHAAGHAAGLRAAEVEAAALRAALQEEFDRRVTQRLAEVSAAAAALNRAAATLSARTAPVLAEADETLAAATMELTEALIGSIGQDTAQFARAALERAISAAGTDPVQRVRLHPDDLAIVTAAVGSDETAGPAVAGVELVADAGLARGDAIAELSNGTIDARLTAAVDRARAALTGGAA